ncbi:OprO/OprP family phosphate-selective porin [Candidatus Methylopumilus planktonicus]|uniref:OprO/OprP family phosphate-selective porin n=1 Tax=Candidatus Methylopumilus planktonicus TaxID=1581557 RepID=UPI003BEED9C3
MNFNKKLAVAVSGAVMLMAGQFALADSTSDIVDALVGKGVLTEEEGKLISKGHETAKSKAAKVEDKKGMLSLSSADGKSTMAIAGRIQLDSRHYSDGDGRSDAAADGFDIRRAYFGVSGKIGKYYDYKVVANLANADTTSGKGGQMDEAFFGINYWKEASFRFGQQKMPFSLEEQTSSRFTDFQERSMLNTAGGMVPAKEMGVQIHGVFGNGVFYGAAISTGEGLNKTEAVTGDSNDLIGRIGINIAKAVGNKDDVYHVAIAGSTGSQGNSSQTAVYNPEDKGAGFFSSTHTAVTGKRDRYGLEGALALSNFKVQGEYMKREWDRSSSVGDADVDGYYVSSSYMITGEKYADSYKDGKFDRISPKKDFNPDDISKGWGAWEIGARYSAVDARGLNLSTASYYNQAQAYTLGLKWIPSPYVRVLMNYVDTEGEQVGGTKLDQKAVTLRTQMDF